MTAHSTRWLKVARKVDSMRAFINLCEKSNRYPQSRIEEMRSELREKVLYLCNNPEGSCLLEDNDLITSHLHKIGFSFDMTYAEKKQRLGIQDRTTLPDRYEDELGIWFNEATTRAQVREWRYRVATECQHLRRKGWYPFFLTLTLDQNRLGDWNYDKQAFWQEGSAWKKFKQDMVDIVATSCNVPLREARSDPSSYVRYAAALEHGKSGDHHHSHVLLWMREIPENWKKCPNRHITDKTYTQCWPLKAYWPWGHAKMDYFRTQNDIWSDLDFVYPSVMKDAMPDFNAGNYLTKYLNKEEKSWDHRFRTTRNLGLQTLVNKVRSLNSEKLLQLMTHPPTLQILIKATRNISEPLRAIRRIARRELLRRLYTERKVCLSTIKLITRSSPDIWLDCLADFRSGVMTTGSDLSERYTWLVSKIPKIEDHSSSLWHTALSEVSTPRRYAQAVPIY